MPEVMPSVCVCVCVCACVVVVVVVVVVKEMFGLTVAQQWRKKWRESCALSLTSALSLPFPSSSFFLSVISILSFEQSLARLHSWSGEQRWKLEERKLEEEGRAEVFSSFSFFFVLRITRF